MIKPLETLIKILNLEENDYEYQDKAVAGGLGRYADTWQKQAGSMYGEQHSAWIIDIAERLRAYSSLEPEARQTFMETLRQTLAMAPPVEEDTALSLPEPLPPQKTRRRPATSPQGLVAPVTVASGVGQKRAQLLNKLGVYTIRDLLYFYPRRYEDYSKLKTIDQLEYDETVSIIGTVWDAGGRKTHGGRHVFRVILSDHTGTLELTWFNQPYLEGRIKPGMQIVVSGKVGQYLGRLTMNAPSWEPVSRKDLNNARILPIYPLTEGLTQRWIRLIIERTLSSWASRVPDPLTDAIRSAYNLIPLSRALMGVHFPDSESHLKAARYRLAFDESLYLQLGLLQQKRNWKSQPGRVVEVAREQLQAFIGSLPYSLTRAQERALGELLGDMASGQPMNRLLQGDVGSGKTAVAALLMAVTVATGAQAAIMAPTEILAEQHYKSLTLLFEKFPEPPSLALLTGRTSGTEREEVYAGLAAGSIQGVVGTHALIQETVSFHDLALAVIDEQHRFGVEQRAQLRQKGYNPHLLVMTATPIPRSLELTVWGHLDVSVLDEMPPGRQAIATRLLKSNERERAYTFIRRQIETGHQAFIIYPLVAASEKIEARAAVDEAERLQKEVFPNLRLGLLHGRMKPDEKERVMASFAEGELDILVATSVVEVGIDVPNATVMLIDGAERFGLAQLHQFRGRVGRGEHQSYCLLLAEAKSEDALERLKAIEGTNDGFVLAQKDLEMRGPGEFLGTRQSGLPDLPMSIYADTRLLHTVREVAAQILEVDPELAQPEYSLLAESVKLFWDKGETS
ncbi:MAG: ATP-dependent DNA helicase RecG [Anaerolineae bacterium]|nr:ATP-dependent DNA helicase RecG [Anaerolineae bacterium]